MVVSSNTQKNTTSKVFEYNLNKDILTICSEFQEPKSKKTNAVIKDAGGKTIFEKNDLTFPESWSQLAVNIAAEKYMYKGAKPSETGTTEETSIYKTVGRIVEAIAESGIKHKYFSSDVEAARFQASLYVLMLNQVFSFNSPVWFNVGVYSPNSLGNRISACFILGIEDSMESILECAKIEGMIYKYGSGSGINYSNLRSKGESLSVGGVSSGPLSFIKAHDGIAGSVKSGGKNRRAAKMTILNVDHPDIEEFIDCKSKEEEKAQALINAGFSSDFRDSDGAYGTVAYQNANHSVRVTDEFMKAVEENRDWNLINRTDGKTAKTVKAKDLFRKIAESAWKSGDPGLQFDDACNAWNTLAHIGRINGSNPCQPANALVLTENGIRTFADLSVGSTIWSGKQWTKVIRKTQTGIKKVFKYFTSVGSFIGTENHQVFSNKERIKVGESESIDICVGPYDECEAKEVKTAILDGLLIGDGWVKSSNQNRQHYILLCVGEKDKDYLGATSPVKELLSNEPFDRESYRVLATNLNIEDLCHLPERRIPFKYLYSDYAEKVSFLKGLYSANGSICGNRVTLKTSCLQLAEDVQAMLSSLGIRSYRTTNKAKKVKFSNGVYECRQSYDVNITIDRNKFKDTIGFIQQYKMDILKTICAVTKESIRPSKNTYDILETEFLGEMPVYDITVDADEHSYWTSGLLVSNCSEYISLDNTSCNLASINLMKFLKEDGFDYNLFAAVSRIVTLALDILICDASYPTEQIAKNVKSQRQIGLGYANLGALLMAQGIPYDSVTGRLQASTITSTMTSNAYKESAWIASKVGVGADILISNLLNIIEQHRDAAFKNGNGHSQSMLKDWDETTDQINKYGARNSFATVIAPTGTIGLQMDCDTTGIEPELSLVKTKKLVGGGTETIVNKTVEKSLLSLGYLGQEIHEALIYIREHGSLEGFQTLKPEHLPVFATSFGQGKESISWEAHIKMLSAVQPFISGASSKTVNMPNTATVEDVEKAYMMAWKEGLKCVAIYRDGCKQSQPLTTKSKEKETLSVKQSVSTNVENGTSTEKFERRRRLPSERQSITHKFVIGGHEGYLTVGLFEDGTPGELFISMSKEGSSLSGLLDSFAISISIALQYGVPLQDLVNKFKHSRYEPSGFTNNKDIHFAASITDYIFKWLENKFLNIKINIPDDKIEEFKQTWNKLTKNPQPAIIIQSDAPFCADCGTLTERNGSCYKCSNCGSTTGCS